MRRCWNCGQPAENESYGVCGETECLKTAIKSRMKAAQKIAAGPRRRRQRRKHNPACRKCSVILIDENWYPSDKRNNSQICKTCVGEYTRKYYHARKAKEAAEKAKFHKENTACRKCSVILIDENWWPSYKKSNNRVCKTCARKASRKYERRRRAKKAKLPTKIKDEWRSLPLDEFTEKVSNAQSKRRGKRKLTKKQVDERRAKEQIRRWCRNKYGKDWWIDHEIRAQRKQEAKEALGLTYYSWL